MNGSRRGRLPVLWSFAPPGDLEAGLRRERDSSVRSSRRPTLSASRSGAGPLRSVGLPPVTETDLEARGNRRRRESEAVP
jgi:hypothetical protein